MAAAVKDKVRLLGEVPAAVDFLLKDEFAYDDEAVAKVRGNAAAKDLLAALAEAFESLADWSADAAKAALGEVAKAAGAKPGPAHVSAAGRPLRSRPRPGPRRHSQSAGQRTLHGTRAEVCGNALRSIAS